MNDEILEKLNERARLARAVGMLKVGQAYRPEREAQVLARVKQNNRRAALRTRRWRCSSARSCPPASRSSARSPWPTSGPRGTFSERATLKHFGLAAEALAAPSIDEVFRAVESGAADFGVVPVENSTEGAVGRSLDLMPQSPLKVCGEVVVRIHHNLHEQGREGLRDDQARVLPRPVARAVPRVAQLAPAATPSASPVSSNAEAARRAAEERGGRRRGGRHGRRALRARRSSPPTSRTSPTTPRASSCWAHYEPKPTGRDKTSLVLSARNRAGAVYEMLTPFAQRGVSMTKFESRPSRVALWDYLFFVDIEGHRDDANVAAALAEVGRIAGFLKVLGSYPMAVL